MAAGLSLSVIAHCLNEEFNVGELARRVLAVFDRGGLKGELILVAFAKIEHRAGNKDESAGQCKRVGRALDDDLEIELAELIGNAGGISFEFNGVQVENIGNPGQVVRLSLPEGYKRKKLQD